MREERCLPCETQVSKPLVYCSLLRREDTSAAAQSQPGPGQEEHLRTGVQVELEVPSRLDYRPPAASIPGTLCGYQQGWRAEQAGTVRLLPQEQWLLEHRHFPKHAGKGVRGGFLGLTHK